MEILNSLGVRITISLTNSEAEWLCMYLHDYSNQANEPVEVTNMRERFLYTLKRALDLLEDN